MKCRLCKEKLPGRKQYCNADHKEQYNELIEIFRSEEFQESLRSEIKDIYSKENIDMKIE